MRQLLAAIGFFIFSSLKAQVVINEVNIAGTTEFIELYNKSSCVVDLSCYTLVFSSTSGGGNPTGWTVKFPLGKSIAPCGYFVIGGTAGSAGVVGGTGYPNGGSPISFTSADLNIGSALITANAVYMKQGLAAGTLPNSGGQITLLDAAGSVVTSVSYNSGNNLGTYPLSAYTTCLTSNNTQGNNNIVNPGNANQNVTASFTGPGIQGFYLNGTGVFVTTSVFTPGSANPSQTGCAPTIALSSNALSACFNAAGSTISLAYSSTTNSPSHYNLTWNAVPINSFSSITNAILPAGVIPITIPAGTSPGIYTGNLTVSNGIGSSCTPVPFTVTVLPAPIVSVATSSSLLCAGNPGILLTASGATNYTWSPATGLSSTIGSTVTANPSITQAYTVTGSDANGCSNTATTTITAASLPPTPVVSMSHPTCGQMFGSFSVTSPSGINYTYSIDGTNFQSSPTFLNLPSGSYQIVAKENNQCISVAATATINAAPATPLAPTVVVVMQPTCSTPTGSIAVQTPLGAGLTYSINNFDYTNTTGVFNNLVSGSYLLTVKNQAGCVSETSAITINPAPATPSVTINSPAICPGTDAFITATPGVVGTYNYVWSVPAGVTDPGNVPSFATNIAGTYGVTIANTSGCTASATGALTITATPSTRVEDKLVCAGASIVLTGQPTGGIWTGNNVNGSTFNATGLSAGTYVVTYTVSSGGCAGSANATITVQSVPPSPNVSVSNGCDGTSTLTVTSQEGALLWSTGETTNLITVSNAGVYSVTQTLNGCTSPAATVIASPRSAPTAPIANVTQPTCTNGSGSIEVTAPIGSGLVYRLNAGAFSTNTNFANLLPAAYTITVRDNFGCESVSSVIINPPPPTPIAPPVAVSQPSCTVATGSITVMSIGVGESYSVDDVNYSNTSGTFVNLSPGVYTVTVRNSAGCISPVTSVTINAASGAISSNKSVCLPEGTIYNFNGQQLTTSGNYTTTFIRPGLCDSIFNLTLSIARTITLNFDGCEQYTFNGTSYTSSVTLRDTLRSVLTNCDSIYLVSNITVHPKVVRRLSVCLPVGQSYQFNGQVLTNSGHYIASLQTINGCDSIVHLSLTITQTTTQQISGCNQVAFNGANYTSNTMLTERIPSVLTGCDSIVRSINIIVHLKPQLRVSANRSVICKGDTVVLNGNAENASIEWIGFGVSDVLVVAPQSTTSYTAVASSTFGCTDTAALTIAVSDFKLQLSANANPVIAGMPVQFQTNATSQYYIILWEPAMPNATAKSQILVADSTRMIKVIGRSSTGCVDADSMLLIVDPLTTVYIPTAFTPNGDGKNDYFTVGGGQFKTFSLKVFNRWGQLLFFSADRSKGWDGRLSGKEQPAGAYVFTLQATTKDGQQVNRSGTVILIR